MRNQKELNKLYSETHFIIDNADKKELFDYIIKIGIENKKQKEVINKINYYLDLFISDESLSKYDVLKILMHIKEVAKEVE